MTIVNSTLVENFASFSGGAAFVRHSANLSIVGSTINDNLANIYGAGKFLYGLLFRALFVCFAMCLGSVLCSFVCFTNGTATCEAQQQVRWPCTALCAT
jgi:hypothetical protein